jgi:hypothetical protein
MKIWKGIALGLLSFVLFFALVVFGIAYTVNQVALNSHYVVKMLNDVDFSQVIQEEIDKQVSSGEIPGELQTALIDTLKKMEPVIKERVGIAIEDTYAYLKGKGDTPNLKDTMSKSVMNSEFIADLLNAVDISQLVDQVVKEQNWTGAGFSAALQDALVTAIDKSEPSLKKQIVNVSDPVFKYLLMQTSSIDLKSTLRQTVISNSFVTEVINNLDYTTMTKDILMEEIGGQLPQGIQLSSQQIDKVVTAIQPYFKTALVSSSGTIADYLIGTRSSFSVKVSLTPAIPSVKTVVREAFMTQLPVDLQGKPQSEIDKAFEQYFTDFMLTIPATYELNSSDLGLNISRDISNAITEAQTSLTDARNSIDTASRDFEDGLKEAHTYVGYFRTGFICIIALIVLLITGIILICRNVKDSCLDLGIVFFLYGVGMFTGVLFAKNIAKVEIAKVHDIPQALSYMPGILLNDIISPLQTISLVCLVGGILLIVASFLYPRLGRAKTE